MSELKRLVNPLTENLLMNNISLGLPIVLTGVTGTGKNILGKAIADDYGYAFINPREGLKDEEVTPMLNLVSAIQVSKGNKLVLVLRSIPEELKKLLGPFLHIRTFRDGLTKERFIQIIPVFSINTEHSKDLGTTVKSQLIYGKDSNKFRSDVFSDKKFSVIHIESTEALQILDSMVNVYSICLKQLGGESALFKKVVFKLDLNQIEVESLVKSLSEYNKVKDNFDVLVHAYGDISSAYVEILDQLFDKSLKVL